MSVSPRSIVLTLLTVGSISIGLVACTGGGGGSDPTPTPTPAFTTCELHWYGAASAAQHLNWYLVQVDPADFTSGTKNYGLTGTAPLGRLFYSFPQTATQVFTSGIASAGNFTLTAATLDVDEAIGFDDQSGQTYFGVTSAGTLGGPVGSGGTGTIDAPMNDRDVIEGNLDATFGTGTIAIQHMGSNLSVGALGTLAVCYDENELFTDEQRIRLMRRAIELHQQQP